MDVKGGFPSFYVLFVVADSWELGSYMGVLVNHYM